MPIENINQNYIKNIMVIDWVNNSNSNSNSNSNNNNNKKWIFKLTTNKFKINKIN